jgi:hypothetical protein
MRTSMRMGMRTRISGSLLLHLIPLFHCSDLVPAPLPVPGSPLLTDINRNRLEVEVIPKPCRSDSIVSPPVAAVHPPLAPRPFGSLYVRTVHAAGVPVASGHWPVYQTPE